MPSQTQIVPPEKEIREQIRKYIQEYIKQNNLTPPLLLEELQHHSSIIQQNQNILPQYYYFIIILLNNEIWRSHIITIPYHQRILLLPQCLRDKNICPAQMDELGLLCENCGQCILGATTEEAENLGYATLIAEGTTVVTQMLQDGELQAVIGVGCLEGLQKAFPHWAKQGIPGLALPLLCAGCNLTKVDEDWLYENIRLPYQNTNRYNIAQLKNITTEWFQESNITKLLEESLKDPTSKLAYKWLVKGGKRWRPLLVAAAYNALAESYQNSSMIQKLAIAVECFHKASLIHDDIEDQEQTRYDEPTLHSLHGIELATNIGDFLVGEGYYWIRECGANAETLLAMLQWAIQGHRQLCIGQGQELFWRKSANIYDLNISEILEVFAQKTAPGFSVALGLGALAAGADFHILEILGNFSRNMGIAYQIQDDIKDFKNTLPNHLSLLNILPAPALETAQQLLEKYRQSALQALQPLHHASLKILLHNILAKVLN